VTYEVTYPGPPRGRLRRHPRARHPVGGHRLRREPEPAPRQAQSLPRLGAQLRQSNKGSGGGAIYGCRSTTGNEPCIRASNLKDGHAFEFATAGKEAGTITVKDTTGAPFTTNATGVATGLNADKVDGNDATDFAAAGDLLFAAVSSSAALGANRGAVGASGGAGSYTVKLNRDVSACSFTATTTDTPAPVAVTPPTAAAKDTVTVTTGDPAAAHAFHLQVIC
jgi:hypothetical protein